MKKSIYRKLTILTLVSLSIGTGIYVKDTVFDAAESDYPQVNLMRGYREIQPLKEVTNYQLEVPLYNQLDAPSLPYGCEVTALGMLLSYYGYDGNKNTLQDQIQKEPYQDENGLMGNPDIGFVGDATGKKPGTGVNHGPIADLAQKVVQNDYQVHDISNQSFDKVIEQIKEGRPVWVVTSIDYEVPSSKDKLAWQTKQGMMTLELKHHAAVVTGVDQTHVYLNDAFGEKKKIEYPKFEKIFKAMGSQAIYLENNTIS